MYVSVFIYVIYDSWGINLEEGIGCIVGQGVKKLDGNGIVGRRMQKISYRGRDSDNGSEVGWVWMVQ